MTTGAPRQDSIRRWITANIRRKCDTVHMELDHNVEHEIAQKIHVALGAMVANAIWWDIASLTDHVNRDTQEIGGLP